MKLGKLKSDVWEKKEYVDVPYPRDCIFFRPDDKKTTIALGINIQNEGYNQAKLELSEAELVVDKENIHYIKLEEVLKAYCPEHLPLLSNLISSLSEWLELKKWE